MQRDVGDSLQERDLLILKFWFVLAMIMDSKGATGVLVI